MALLFLIKSITKFRSVPMKTVVKIDPEKEYLTAKEALESISATSNISEIGKIDGSLDNLKTVINVLIERLTSNKGVKPKNNQPKNKKEKKKRDEVERKPSEKYPELAVKENILKLDTPPKCSLCCEDMKESGLFKISEKLEIIPKQYYITRNKRVIYNCGHCNGSLKNTPTKPSISPQSNYGDSLIIDATLSKYCDLIPMERYCSMASREGLEGIPPNTLIGLTHSYADFLKKVYKKIKLEVSSSNIVRADETPHKMLEGDDTKNWYLWGFSSRNSCYFEAHNTRSGDVPINFLKNTLARYLLTDGYSGYKRAIKELIKEGKKIFEIFCNAHAVRYFKESSSVWESETEPFLKLYGEIYKLEKEASKKEERIIARKNMEPLFFELKKMSEKLLPEVMPESKMEKSLNYFLNHYEGLTRCLEDINIPLDNNQLERQLRSPVVGRKTWIGTHSKRGARTAAALFSIVESCKLNNINPRKYFPWVTKCILNKEEILTPFRYANLPDSG